MQKGEKRHLTSVEKRFIVDMARTGDATKAAQRIWPKLSDQMARVYANGYMRRPEIYQAVEYLRDLYKKEEQYIESL